MGGTFSCHEHRVVRPRDTGSVKLATVRERRALVGERGADVEVGAVGNEQRAGHGRLAVRAPLGRREHLERHPRERRRAAGGGSGACRDRPAPSARGRRRAGRRSASRSRRRSRRGTGSVSSSSRVGGDLARERLAEAGQLGEVQVEVGAGEQLGDAAAAVGLGRVADAERAPEVALDERDLGSVSSGPSRPSDEARVEVLGVGVEEARRARPSWPRARATSRRPCRARGRGRAGARTRTRLARRARGRSPRSRRASRRRRRAARRSARRSGSSASSTARQRLRDLARRQDHADRCGPWPRAAARAGSRARRSCARRASVAAQVDGEPAAGAAEAPPRGRDAHRGEPLDRHAVAVQRALEALVLERLARLEPADLRRRSRR